MKRKLLLTISSFALAATPVVASVSCSSFLTKNGGSASRKSDLEFWNYEDYINNNDEDPNNAFKIISESYNYHPFGDLPDLKQGILEEKVAAGVGSDYFNSQLAGMGLIQKIDFSKLFGISPDRSTWKEAVKELYTHEVWELMKSFTLKKYVRSGNGYKVQYINGKTTADVDGDGTDDELWEYMVPYFIQNKVIAFNPWKITPNTSNSADLSILKGTDQDLIEGVFAQGAKKERPTYKQALNKLHDLGFRDFLVNDYFRDNLMIGSENADGSSFTGGVASIDAGKGYISNYMSMLSNWNITGWETSGVKSLSSLVEGYTGTKAQVSMIYNGDALYAYNGAEIEGGKDKQVRIITPKNPTFLLDGVVIPTYLKEDWFETERVYSTLRNALYQGVFAKSTSSNYTRNQIFQNFDYVNYTPAFQELHEYVRNEYFKGDDGSIDEVGQYIAMSTWNAREQINSEHITQPIPDLVEQALENEFKNQHHS